VTIQCKETMNMCVWRRSGHFISALYQEFEGLPVEEEDTSVNDGDQQVCSVTCTHVWRHL
jgi:hypothetical protein